MSVVVASSEVLVGDEIAVGGVLGKVEDVAKRSTVLRTGDGRLVYIPNSVGDAHDRWAVGDHSAGSTGLFHPAATT